MISTELFSPPSKHTSLLIFVPLRPGQPTPGLCPFDVSLSLNLRWLRNLNRMCIDYASRPRLSPRLTRSGRTFLLKPQSFGHYDSHIILATHSGILTRIQSTTAFAMTSPHIILATHSGILTRIQSTTAFAMTSPRIRRSPTNPVIHKTFNLLYPWEQFACAKRLCAF